MGKLTPAERMACASTRPRRSTECLGAGGRTGLGLGVQLGGPAQRQDGEADGGQVTQDPPEPS